MTEVFNRKSEKDLRRQLRGSMPSPEVLLWSRLQGKQLAGLKFRRQHSVGPYVLDFYCPARKLAVEVDGDSHYQGGGPAHDAARGARTKEDRTSARSSDWYRSPVITGRRLSRRQRPLSGST